VGGWVRSGSASVGFIGAALFFCVVRGPYETRWVGWRGGWSLRKKPKSEEPGGEWVSKEDEEKNGAKKETNTEKALEEFAGEDEEERAAKRGPAEEMEVEKSMDVSSKSSIEVARKEDEIRPAHEKA